MITPFAETGRASPLSSVLILDGAGCEYLPNRLLLSFQGTLLLLRVAAKAPWVKLEVIIDGQFD